MVSKKLLVVLGLCLALAAFSLTRSEDPFVEDIDFTDPIAFSEDPLDVSVPTVDAGTDDGLGEDGEPELVVWTPPAEPRDPFTQLTGGVSESLIIDDEPLDDEDLGLDEDLG